MRILLFWSETFKTPTKVFMLILFLFEGTFTSIFKAVIQIQIRIHMFLGLPDPDPLVKGMDPDPDPSIIMQKW